MARPPGGNGVEPGPPDIPPERAGLPAWWNGIRLNDKGVPKAISLNGDYALSNDPAFAGAFRLDRLRGESMLCAPVPWDESPLHLPRSLTDRDDYEAMLWLQENHINLGIAPVHDIVNGIAGRSSFHPVLDYFGRCKWDGTPRIGRVGDDAGLSWLTYYCGVEDSDYVRAVGSRWLISAVARVCEPGCQADSVLILEGDTGIGKSSTFRVLGGAWYSSNLSALNTKDALEQLQGVWIIELDELDAVQRSSEWTAVLSFVSRSSDRFRVSYGRRVGLFPRQGVFGGTTERDTWARGIEGRRRWWPVRCGSRIDLEALIADRDQLWAEAIVRYSAGERWHLHEPELIAAAFGEAEARVELDPWENLIVEFMAGKKLVTTCQILLDQIGVSKDRLNKLENMRVASVLKKYHWKRRYVRIPNQLGKKEPKWCYVAPDYVSSADE